MFDKDKMQRALAEIQAATASWADKDAAEMEPLLRESLESVTHLTEYEDEKASRIMTAMAFVGALVAAVHALAFQYVFPRQDAVFVVLNFCLVCFYFFAVVGSTYVVYGIAPRFNLPKHKDVRPRSLLFAREIERVTGTVWAAEFVGRTVEQVTAQSARHQLEEIKLIAHKALRKVATLHRASLCYGISLGFLIGGMLALGIGIVKKALPQSHAVIVFDADNTLWDTNELYAQAQETLVARLEKLTGKRVVGDRVAYLRRFDEEIAQNHPDGFRYPIRLLTERMYQELSGKVSSLPPDAAAVFGEFEHEYLSTIAGSPQLFPGAKETLSALVAKGYRLVLLSEGDPVLVRDRLAGNAIRDYFTDVLVKKKVAGTFEDLRSLHGSEHATTFFSVGDRLDVDMRLAAKAGYRTIFLPGKFRPFESSLDCWRPDATAVSLNEIPALVDALR